jgi:hypothetical protein
MSSLLNGLFQQTLPVSTGFLPMIQAEGSRNLSSMAQVLTEGIQQRLSAVIFRHDTFGVTPYRTCAGSHSYSAKQCCFGHEMAMN